MRVLVIDDNAFIRTMFEMVLGLEGFETHFAEDGEEGLAAARELQPDVIVLDILMPGMDGRAVARELAEDAVLKSVPLIFCSSLSDPEDIWAGWQVGAASYLPKPVDPFVLVEEILRVTRPVDLPNLHPAVDPTEPS